MNIESRLTDIAADMLTESHGFLERLLLSKEGKWLTASILCKGLDFLSSISENKAEKELELLENEAEGVLLVTWLSYPETAYGEGYCIIIFFVESIHWSTIAVFNKDVFLQNLS